MPFALPVSSKQPLTQVILSELATSNLHEFASSDIYKILDAKHKLPACQSPRANIAQNLKYLEKAGHIEKTVSGAKKSDGNKYRLSRKGDRAGVQPPASIEYQQCLSGQQT